MHKQNFITLTLIISGLAFSPVVAENIEHRADIESAPTQTQNQNPSSVISSISSVLYNRGLEEETANKLALALLEGEDEMYFSLLLRTLDAQNIVSREESLEYLSTVALHKKKLDFKSYDSLVGMVAHITKSRVDAHTLKQLSYLAKVNKQVFV